MENPVRWSLKVSKETDEALRAHLGQAGARKGDLSKFVQEAVQTRLKAERRTAGKPGPSAGRLDTSRDTSRDTRRDTSRAARRDTSRAARRDAARDGLAEALAEIRARTGALSKARFETLVAEAVAYARKRR